MAMVRNSDILGTLADVVQGPVGSLRAVEIAGRGIAAEVRCTLAGLEDKNVVHSDPADVAVQRALDFAERLMELGEVGESLAELWRDRRTEKIDDQTFEARLGDLVRRLEE